MYSKMMLLIISFIVISCNKPVKEKVVSNEVNCDSLNVKLLKVNYQNDSLKNVISGIDLTKLTVDYSLILSGKFILDDNVSTCAGFTFLNDKKRIIWTNEMTCLYPDTFQLVWISNDVFLYRDINPPIENKKNSRRSWLKKVMSFNGNELVLRDYWMGGGNYSEEVMKFRKEDE
jgi:hypothetical protein